MPTAFRPPSKHASGMHEPAKKPYSASPSNLMNRLTLRMEAGYVKEDVLIWSRKRYLTHPRLNGADGEILAYRRYCQQFYPEANRMEPRLIASQT
ncbi:MAG: hypothetical protein F4149_08385 [Gammaproteobacteria bacterium]|nr:hypothetical protein [Gammaproteobacteria bacterium]MYK82428.1 hypothetical protein [Gammaproteobacteria bacterium]